MERDVHKTTFLGRWITKMVSAEFVAGFIEGEGWIGSWKPLGARQLPQLRVELSNTNRSVLDAINERFPGTIYTCVNKRKAEHKVQYKLHYSGKDAAALLYGVVDFLVGKKEQAQLGLAFYEFTKLHRVQQAIQTGAPLEDILRATRKTVPQSIIDYGTAFHTTMARLNRKGA